MVVDADGSVLAHQAVILEVEEPVQIGVGGKGTQEMAVKFKTLIRAHAGAGVKARVIGFLNPAGETGVEFLQTGNPLSRQAQKGFKIFLDGAKEALHFSLAPGMIRFGVKEADAEISANEFGVVIDERTALIGVKFMGQAAAAQGLFKSLVKTSGVGRQIIGGKRNEA